MLEAAPVCARPTTPEHHSASSLEEFPDNPRRLLSSLTNLSHIADPGRRELRPTTAFSASRGGDGVRDLAGLDALRNEAVRHGHMNPRSAADSEQHGDSILMPLSEAIHQRRDLAAIFELRFGDV